MEEDGDCHLLSSLETWGRRAACGGDRLGVGLLASRATPHPGALGAAGGGGGHSAAPPAALLNLALCSLSPVMSCAQRWQDREQREGDPQCRRHPARNHRSTLKTLPGTRLALLAASEPQGDSLPPQLARSPLPRPPPRVPGSRRLPEGGARSCSFAAVTTPAGGGCEFFFDRHLPSPTCSTTTAPASCTARPTCAGQLFEEEPAFSGASTTPTWSPAAG